MTDDERHIQNLVERLNIDTAMDHAYKEDLRRHMSRAFERARQPARSLLPASHRMERYILGLLGLLLLVCKIVRLAWDPPYALILTALSIVLGIAMFTCLRTNPFRIVPHPSMKGT